jgi:predicted transcriptional regulator
MTDEKQEQLRDIDQVVLQKIEKGHDDTQKITAETTLETHQVRYSLKKLEQLDLVNLTKPDGMVERAVDGQKRVFKTPTQAQLTRKGINLADSQNKEGQDQYEDLSKEELVSRMRELEREVEELKQSFNVFRKQVRREI